MTSLNQPWLFIQKGIADDILLVLGGASCGGIQAFGITWQPVFPTRPS